MIKKIIVLMLLVISLSSQASADVWGESLGTMTMKAKYLEGDLLELTIYCKDMKKPILGTAFHLHYDGEKLDFLKYHPGDFLERGGKPIYLVSNKENGKLIFGSTLKRNDSLPIGDGALTQIYFVVKKSDEFNFSFQRGVVSTLDEVRQDIDFIDWKDLQVKGEVQTSISKNGELSFLTASSITVDGEITQPDKSYYGVISVVLIVIAVIYMGYRLIKNKRGRQSVN